MGGVFDFTGYAQRKHSSFVGGGGWGTGWDVGGERERGMVVQ